MDDTLLVRGFERVGDLAGDRERFLARNRPQHQTVRQRWALDQFEHQRWSSLRVFQPVDGADVRMIQRGEKLRLTTEPRDTIGIAGENLRKDLERNLAAQRGIAGSIHFAHPAGADGADDFVRTESNAGGDTHDRGLDYKGLVPRMRCFVIRWSMVLLLSVVAAGVMLSGQTGGSVVAIKAARLFAGTGETSIADAVVIVDGGHIRAAGVRLAVPPGAQVIDLGDATILPGFIDAHTHLTDEGSEDWNADTVAGLRRGVPEATLRAAEFARRTLMAGFTTVRDVVSRDYIDAGLRNAIASGLTPGPRMLVSVHALGARGGHCDNTGFPYQLFGAEPGVADGIASGPDQFRDAVRFQVKYGADVIKVCATGGVLSLGDDVGAAQITQAEMDALVDEAHRLHRRVAAHAHGAEGAKVAVRAGIDSIEHGSFLDDEVVRMMKERGTYLVPTLMAGEYAGGRKAVRRFPPEIAAKAIQALDGRSTAFKRALAAGVQIAFGTDSGVSPHGRNAEEFTLLVDHGMTPAAALRTSVAAATLLGVGRSTGTIEAGNDADLVAVPGDVLKTISATERVRFVMKGGKIVRNDTTPQSPKS